jgi:hypothetical protein
MRSNKSHVVEFVIDWWAELEWGNGRPLEQVLLRRGTRRSAVVRPRILRQGNAPIEAADLFFDDGTIARGVPFAAFTFVE